MTNKELFDTIQIRPEWKAKVEAAANKVAQGMNRYVNVSQQMKYSVPWHLIGLIHLMESDCNFKTHLHNGDSLNTRTIHVPKGRPVEGQPPFTWEFSALDALNYDNIKGPLHDAGSQLDALERFNGMGYRRHGINSPYLWSGTNHYTKGKYTSDGLFDPEAVSKQIGAAAVLKVLRDRGLIKV